MHLLQFLHIFQPYSIIYFSLQQFLLPRHNSLFGSMKDKFSSYHFMILHILYHNLLKEETDVGCALPRQPLSQGLALQENLKHENPL